MSGKSTVFFLTVTAALASPLSAKPVTVLLQEGIYQEETLGDLDAAIKIYQQVVNQELAARPHVVRAKYRWGVCLLKKGNQDQAVRAFTELIEQFPDQRAHVDQAKIWLAKLGHAPTTVPAGMNLRRIWREVGEHWGSISPDPRHFTYSDWSTGGLHLADLSSGESRLLTDEGFLRTMYSLFSPAGDRVAFARLLVDEHALELCLIDTAGGEIRVLRRSDASAWLHPTTWSPDGKQIVGVASRRNAPSQIVSIAVADGSLRSLREFPPPRYPERAMFFPDGRCLAFQVQQTDDVPEHDIFLLAADGSWEKPLVEHAADDCLLGWIPDGRGVLFCSDRKGTPDAWMAPVQGSEPSGRPTLIKSDLGEVCPWGFSAQGAFFYATWGEPDDDLFFATLDPTMSGAAATVERAEFGVHGNNSALDWSPDGTQLAYASVNKLVIRSLDTGEERQFALGIREYALRWSPDGNSILVRGRRFPEGIGFYRFDLRTEEVTPVVLPGGKGPCWSPDGRVIYYARNECLAAFEVGSGTERIIHRASAKVRSLALSPDGRRLAFVAGGNLLQVIGVVGDQPPQLVLALQERIAARYAKGALAWAVDGNHLLYGTYRGDPPKKYDVQLWRIAATGGQPEPVGLAAKHMRDLRIHPAGQRIAFVAGGFTPPEMWVMENFLPTQKEAPR